MNSRRRMTSPRRFEAIAAPLGGSSACFRFCKDPTRRISGGCVMPDSKMPPQVDGPGYWRFRAENARKQADEMKDKNAKIVVLNIAEQYERRA